MTMKKFLPTGQEVIKFAIMSTVFAVTGIGAMIVAKTGGIFKRR